MPRSMTGFATREGAADGWSWVWEIRAVNGRGLDIRLRLPDGIDGVEAPLRAAIQTAVARGNVTASLRLTREDAFGGGALNAGALASVIGMLKTVEERAIEADLALAQSSAAEILSMRGIVETGADAADLDALRAALLAEVAPLLDDFNAMRDAEGRALGQVIAAQIDGIGEGTRAARELTVERADHMKASFRQALDRIRDAANGVDEARIAQEMALLAVKADVAEELDRLEAHVAAARDLLAGDGPMGRKLDFLTQEFNREANTLCSKSQFAALTRVGLDLKHTIDQMREQVQNVE